AICDESDRLFAFAAPSENFMRKAVGRSVERVVGQRFRLGLERHQIRVELHASLEGAGNRFFQLIQIGTGKRCQWVISCVRCESGGGAISALSVALESVA